MTVELSRFEAELLIGILTGAEQEFAVTNPALSNALAALRPWRSVLICAYIRSAEVSIADEAIRALYPEAPR